MIVPAAFRKVPSVVRVITNMDTQFVQKLSRCPRTHRDVRYAGVGNTSPQYKQEIHVHTMSRHMLHEPDPCFSFSCHWQLKVIMSAECHKNLTRNHTVDHYEPDCMHVQVYMYSIEHLCTCIHVHVVYSQEILNYMYCSRCSMHCMYTAVYAHTSTAQSFL